MRPVSGAKQRLLHTALDLLWQRSYGSISVDDICSQAAVNKGSFYYAFRTKSELAVAAFESHWNELRPGLDAVFSSQNDPVARLDQYCDLVVRDQLERYRALGKILGCPFCSLGCELSTQDHAVRAKAREICDRIIRYLVAALRDAIAQGVLPANVQPDALGREVFCYRTGVLMQAKIENNPEALNDLKPGLFRHLGLAPVTKG